MTGGLGRLGSQYVRALAAAGASVAAFDVEGAKSAIVQGLVDADQRVSTHTVDAADRAAVDAAMAAVAARFGTPTILVNNAGLGSSPADAALETGPFERYPESAWQAMLDSHLKTAFVASQSFLDRFRTARARNSALEGAISVPGDDHGSVHEDPACSKDPK